MFVSTQKLRRNPKLYFFNDKSLPTGSISERDVTPVLNCWVNPIGQRRIQTFFEMTQKKEFVSGNAVCVTVTPAQKALLQLISGNAQDLALYLKDAQERATYLCDFEITPQQLRGDYHLLSLQEAIQNLASESLTKNLSA